MRDTFFHTHWRGFYFRILGYGFLVNVTDRPLFGLRTKGCHIGPVWWRWLTPMPDGVHYCRPARNDGPGAPMADNRYLPKLYRGIADRLKPTTKDSAYSEGWNDALYKVLDILDGQEPIAALIDGSDG